MRKFRLFTIVMATAAVAAAAPPICVPYPISANVQTLGTKQAVTLVVIGDTGNDAAPEHGGLHIKDLAKAISDSGVKPDAVLLVGDNFYECGVSSASDPHFAMYAPLMQLGVPMFVVLGNHDYGDAGSGSHCTNANPQAEVDHRDATGNWRLVDRNYVLRWPGLADIAVYDTTPVKNGCSDRKPILDNLAAAIAAMPKGEWRIVTGHHTLYSSGEHGQSCNDGAVMRKLLDPMLQTGRVDLYLSGHDHDAEISNLNRRPMFVVSGSGSRTRSAGAKPGNPSFFIRFAFAVVDITPTTLTARLYDIQKKQFVAKSTLTQPGAATPPSGSGSAPVPSCHSGS